ncbi:unnamed protein product [Heligmosomoides polygyrus]|uniref:SSD domain-containing protein n=1 Tax=Heligmosomoides polygyrus TaxID=6339 RepID=A0A183FAI2_HELPZ|nr:unnamed protein product [Heligmosomoides polygyrus]
MLQKALLSAVDSPLVESSWRTCSFIFQLTYDAVKIANSLLNAANFFLDSSTRLVVIGVVDFMIPIDLDPVYGITICSIVTCGIVCLKLPYKFGILCDDVADPGSSNADDQWLAYLLKFRKRALYLRQCSACFIFEIHCRLFCSSCSSMRMT